ncbi:MAG: hypothetical protein M1436_03355, partial [Acidobacteria bacterium]|nr:hypothetical protein [Acidobacteriota bacterium]
MLSRLAAKRAGSSLLAYPAVEAMATAVLAVCLLPAQPPQPLPDHTEASTPAQRPAPVPLTPERRGDILMVRKMYREAIETYREAPQSAIVLNKIGIAYHQIAQLDMAKRYYERSIKLDPRYSEAINNLGTIHYARRSYRPFQRRGRT